MSIEIVNSDAAMFQKSFGEEIGKYMQSEHEKNGVKVHNNVRA